MKLPAQYQCDSCQTIITLEIQHDFKTQSNGIVYHSKGSANEEEHLCSECYLKRREHEVENKLPPSVWGRRCWS